MREQKFTPGPWVYKATGHRVYIRGQSTDGSNEVCEINELWVKPITFSANANLIAAAPELLEALELAVRVLGDSGFGTDCFQVAIAKAYGEES